MADNPFHIQMTPDGYQEKVSPDLVAGTWLCRGSQNMLVAPDGSVQTRKGLTLKGDRGDNTTSPLKWATTWDTNTGVSWPMRSRYNELQILYKNVWRTIANGFGGKVRFDTDPWWDKDELKDRLLLVNGQNTIWTWLGGVSEAYSGTTTTLTKKYVTARNGGGNNFVFNAANKTITATWADFVALGFQAGDVISVVGGASPNVGVYKIRTVTTTVLTLTADETIVDETNTGTISAPAGVTASIIGGGNLSATTAYYYKVTAIDAYGGETTASTEVSATTTSTALSIDVTWNQIDGVSGYNIYRSTTAGVYTSPSKLVTNGSTTYLDNGSVTTLKDGTPPGANTMGMFIAVRGKETWAAERFSSTGELSFMSNGIKYTYTGGFNTPTLTGITPNLPTITSGDIIYSPVLSRAPTGGDIPSVATYDVLMVNENQAWIGSSQRRDVFISKNSNFRDFGYTAGVRKSGEGGTIIIDGVIRSINVSEEGKVYITAGERYVYTAEFHSTTVGTTAGEEIKVKRIKTSQGGSANNTHAVTNTKNGLAYLSNEPSFDYLAQVELIDTQQQTPLSDPISGLVTRLDTRDVWSLYHLNTIFILFPAESTLLMYDVDRKLWQPPQFVAGNALSVIDSRVVVHSSINSNSFTLFDGGNDDGTPIGFRAVFNYRNGDLRAMYKTEDRYFVELRANQAAEGIVATVDLGYEGSVDSVSATIGASDGPPYVEEPTDAPGIGANPIGSVPIGGFYAATDQDDQLGTFVKIRRAIAITALGKEFFEQRFRIESDTLDTHFQLLAHGENMVQSPTYISNLIKE